MIQGSYITLSDHLTRWESAHYDAMCEECGANVGAGRQFIWGGSGETMCSSICAERHHDRLRTETHCDREPMSFERQCLSDDLACQPVGADEVLSGSESGAAA